MEKSGTSDTDSVKILVWLQHRFNRIVMNLLGLLRLQDQVLIQTTFVVDFVQYHMPFPSSRKSAFNYDFTWTSNQFTSGKG